MCILLCLAWPAKADAQHPSSSAPTALLESLRRADETLTQLEALWPTLEAQRIAVAQQLERAQRQLASLQGALTLWRQSSIEWEQQSQSLAASLATAQSSLDELTQRYATLSRAWQEYRQQVLRETDRRERSVRAWRAAAVLGPIIAAGLGWLVGTLVPVR